MHLLKLNNLVQQGHISILVFVLTHFVLGIFTGYRLQEYLVFSLKVLVYISGFILFVQALKPLKTIAIYYSFYALTALLTGMLMLFGVIFFAIVSALFLFPIVPKEAVFATDELIIYSRFQGFMAPCCSYEVVVPQTLLLEKHLGFIHVENPIDQGSDVFRLQGNKLFYTHKKEFYGPTGSTTRDTTEVLLVE
jgi:hypothetical protein